MDDQAPVFNVTPESFQTDVIERSQQVPVLLLFWADQVPPSAEARVQLEALVAQYQGKVLLTGQSPNADLTARAKQIAMGVEGTTEVYNEIRQGTPVSLSTASSDTWITTKVRSQLLTSDTVKSSTVKVTTENGEVFLLGLVTQQEGQSAAQIASQVSGVKHVTTAFTYVK